MQLNQAAGKSQSCLYVPDFALRLVLILSHGNRLCACSLLSLMTPDMADYHSPAREAESRAPLIYGLAIFFVSLSCASVVLRLYTRYVLNERFETITRLTPYRLWILHTFGREDTAIIVAQTMSFAVSITTILQVARGGLGRHVEFVSREEYIFAIKVHIRSLHAVVLADA